MFNLCGGLALCSLLFLVGVFLYFTLSKKESFKIGRAIKKVRKVNHSAIKKAEKVRATHVRNRRRRRRRAKAKTQSSPTMETSRTGAARRGRRRAGAHSRAQQLPQTFQSWVTNFPHRFKTQTPQQKRWKCNNAARVTRLSCKEGNINSWENSNCQKNCKVILEGTGGVETCADLKRSGSYWDKTKKICEDVKAKHKLKTPRGCRPRVALATSWRQILSRLTTISHRF